MPPVGVLLAAAADTTWAVVVIALLIFWVGGNFAKGKPVLALGGFVFGILWPIGMFRLARPKSKWARAMYDDAKMERAKQRYARWECKACRTRFAEKATAEDHIASEHPGERKRLKNRGRGI